MAELDSQQAKRLLETMLQAENNMDYARAFSSALDFVEGQSMNRKMAFSVQAMLAGTSVFRAGLNTDMSQWPRNFTRFIAGITTIFVGEFERHPHEASGLLYALLHLMHEPGRDKASDAWFGYLLASISQQLGRNVQDVMREQLQH